jgi:hypothetical protein
MLTKSDLKYVPEILAALKANDWDKAYVADVLLKISYSFVRDVYDHFYGLNESIAFEAIERGICYAEIVKEVKIKNNGHYNGYVFEKTCIQDLDRFGAEFTEVREFIVSTVQPDMPGWKLVETITYAEQPARWVKLVLPETPPPAL